MPHNASSEQFPPAMEGANLICRTDVHALGPQTVGGPKAATRSKLAPRSRWMLVWIGFILSLWPVAAVPPLATNVTVLGSWPSYVTGRATDARLINDHLYVSL